MTNYYVWSGGSNTSPYNSFATAATTVGGLLALPIAAGDDIWVAHDHSETTAGAVIWTVPGTLAAPNRIICVNRAGGVSGAAPFGDADKRTTAVVANTTAANIQFSGYAYVYGIAFNANSVANTSNITIGGAGASNWVMESCNCFISNLASGSFVFGSGGAATARMKMKNCNLKVGGVGQALTPLGNLEWDGGAWDGSLAVPTTMLTNSNSRTANFLFQNVDFSAFSTGKTLVGNVICDGTITFRNCKLNATLPTLVAAATSTTGSSRVEFIDCDSGNSNYKNVLIDRCGRMDDEGTIVRTGGASDGTRTLSHKIVPNATNAKWSSPFLSKPIVFWNESLSAITITVQGIWSGGARPFNDDIWLEAYYSNDATSPILTPVSTGLASILATHTQYAAGSGTWGGSTTPFQMVIGPITPLAKGPITLNIKAVTTGTYYIDPKPIIT